MIRILQSVSNMNRGGIETMLMNYYRHIDRDKLQFDFLLNRPVVGDYEAEIKSLGGRIFMTPGYLSYTKYRDYIKTLSENYPEYKIIHAHNGEMMAYALKAAKDNGIPVRIAHAHNTKIDLNLKYLIKYFIKKTLPSLSTNIFGCSDKAGAFYFGNDWKQSDKVVVHNAIDSGEFAYNTDYRAELHKKYNLDGKFVIGHVGRFSRQKNHKYLIEIFKNIYQQNKNARLVLVGSGERLKYIKHKIHIYGLDNAVIMPGTRTDVHKWYSAMDVFVLPSLYEGLPVVGVEAQCSGLKCLFSDRITKEAKLTNNAEYLSIAKPAKFWADKILSLEGYTRQDCSKDIVDSGYDISSEAEKLQNMYIEMHKAAME